MNRKLPFWVVAGFLCLQLSTITRPALAIDPIIVPIPVLNVYDQESYFHLAVSGEDEGNIGAIFTLNDQSIEAALNLDSILKIEYTVDGALKSPSISAFPEEGGFTLSLTNLKNGQVRFSIEGGEELKGEVTAGSTAAITLQTSQTSRLELVRSDGSLIIVDAAKNFLSLAPGFPIPVRFSSSETGTVINTTGGGSTGGEPDQGGDTGGDITPLGSTGGCALQSSASHLPSTLSILSVAVGISAVALRRKVSRMRR